jgi:hypothetical protein
LERGSLRPLCCCPTGDEGRAVRHRRTLSDCGREMAAPQDQGGRPGRLFAEPEAVAAGKRGPRRCSKTASRPASGRPTAVMFEQPAQPLFADHLGGVGRRPFGRGRRPARRRVPVLPPFCVRNRSDPKTTERDAKFASIFLVMTCGFRQREYWGISQMASWAGVSRGQVRGEQLE